MWIPARRWSGKHLGRQALCPALSISLLPCPCRQTLGQRNTVGIEFHPRSMFLELFLDRVVCAEGRGRPVARRSAGRPSGTCQRTCAKVHGYEWRVLPRPVPGPHIPGISGEDAAPIVQHAQDWRRGGAQQ